MRCCSLSSGDQKGESDRLSTAPGGLQQFIQGLSLIGNTLTSVIRYALSVFSVNFSDAAIRVFGLIMTLLLVWKVGSTAIKIVLAFVAVSLAAGFLAPVLGLPLF